MKWTASPSRSPVVAYGVAVASSAAALAVTWILVPIVETTVFPPALAAVFLSTWYGGLGPGIVAIVVTWFYNDAILIGPGRLLFADPLGETVRNALYLVTAVLTGVLAGALHRAQRRAEVRAEAAQRHVEALGESDARFQALLADAQASEARFRRVVEAAPDGIVIANQQGRIVLANSQAHRLFDYGDGELVGRPVEELIPPSARQAHVGHRESYAAMPRTRPMGAGLELLGFRSDGSDFPVEISLSPLQTDEGLLVMAAIRDITERRAVEGRIRALNQDLQHRLAELGALNRELESFSYSVSHDLRAPLRSIDGFSQALLEDYADRLDATGRDYLTRVRAATQRMGDLIDDLLTLSRVTRREMRHEPVDLSALARAIAGQLQRNEPQRMAEVVVAGDCCTQGDPHLLRVALENLLGNAWKFTSQAPHPRIEFGRVEATEAGAPVYFVRDNGVGFDMAYSGKLFGAFQRLHRAAEFPGTGIGLATVQRIITRHGGQVWAEAEPGKGATFYFTLPGEGR